MRKIYTIGETIYDIIFKDEQPVAAKPGGALLNTSVSLGRLGADVSLVGDLADDVIGRYIVKFLNKNGVNTDYICTYTNALSRLALAFLDSANNAEYSFYKIRKEGAAHLNYPDIKKDDVVLFGSFYAIKPELHGELIKFIERARAAGAIIVYDPNFRAAHRHELPSLKPMILKNMELSHIVKGSDEDFLNIFGTDNATATFDELKSITDAALIYTANRHGVWLHTPLISEHYNALPLHPVSTIGAGDTFMAGIGYTLIANNITFTSADELTKESWDILIKNSIQFSGHVCMHYDNYVSEEFAQKYKLA